MTALHYYRPWLALFRVGLLFVFGCFVSLAIGLQFRTLKEAGWGLDKPLPPVDAPARQIPFLGINVALEQAPPSARRATLQRLKSGGFGWVRQRIDWGASEPQPHTYHWQQSDALLADIQAAGLLPVIVLDGSPTWARAPQDMGAQDNPLAPPAAPATLARFAAAFAQRYQSQVHFYQIWDEPNIAPHWGNRHIDPVAYAQLLKTTAQAIRTQNPEAVIITAALAPTADRGHTAIDEVYFLQRLYAAGAAPFFDAVAVEPFGFSATPTDPREQNAILNFQRLKLVRRAMIAAGDGATPLWAVRYGWNIQPASPWGTVRLAEQIGFARQALTIARIQWPWLATLAWVIDSPARPPNDPLWGFALTPDLAKAMQEAANQPQSEGSTAALRQPAAPFLSLWFLSMALGLVIWRSYAALVLLPWSGWAKGYRAWSPVKQAIVWGLLLFTYLFTTWPPLILLCWLCAAVLIAAQPQVGLWLAAAALPFYFQHKEVVLVETTWVVAPAQAAALCLIPALCIHLQTTCRSALGGSMRERIEASWPEDVHHSLQGTTFWEGLIRSVTKRIKPSRQAIEQVFAPLRHCVTKFSQQPIDAFAWLWLLLSLLTSVNIWQWPAYWNGLFELVLMPLLLYSAVRRFVVTPEQGSRVVVALFSGGLFAALFGLVDWWRGNGVAVDGVLRLVGPYFSPNQTALYLVRTLFIGSGLALSTAKHQRRWWLSCAVITVALLLTASRGAWLLGVPAGTLLMGYFLLQSRHGQALKWRASWWIIGLCLLALVTGMAFFWQRLTNLTSASQRLLTWQATWRLWLDVPWLGVGPDGFFWRYPAYLSSLTLEPDLQHPHNMWLEFAAGWGISGLLWLLGLLTVLVQTTRRVQTSPGRSPRPWLVIGLLAALAAGLAHAQVDAFAALPDLAAWNWLALALWVQLNPWPIGLATKTLA